MTMRSQAVTLAPSAERTLTAIAAAYTAIELAQTPTEAADIWGQAKALDAAVRAANLGLDAQNQAAHLRLEAERKLGQLLSATKVRGSNQHTGATMPEGLNFHQSSRAQKIARIPDEQWETFIENTMSAGKELTQAAALRLSPVAERPERKSIADTYTAPPIDVQLAREFGLDVSDEIAEIIVTAIRDALNDLENRRHAFVWAKYHGINDDGTIGERWVFPGIATMLNASREYTESLYYRASHHVRGRIAVEALNALQRHLIATS